MTKKISGLWLPFVTPFKDGAVDFSSYERLIEHTSRWAWTGCSRSAPRASRRRWTRRDRRAGRAHCGTVAGRVPVFVGVGGNATRKVEKALSGWSELPSTGIVWSAPSTIGRVRTDCSPISAPSPRRHRDVLIYNILYRTAVNLTKTRCSSLPRYRTSWASRTVPAASRSRSSCFRASPGVSRC